MAYWNWINDIYNFEDAVFQCFRSQDEARQLARMLKEKGVDLYDDDGNYIIELKDEYDGFKLKNYENEKLDAKETIKDLKQRLSEAEKELEEQKNKLYLGRYTLEEYIKYLQKDRTECERFHKECIKDLKQRLSEAENVIDFYADKNSWKKQNQVNQTIINSYDVEYCRISNKDYYLNYGGKRAREYQEKYGNPHKE